ncbi:trem-like transcript 4 protein [Nycticebus coucang]|uniref:trem-like transcript 4 protein n=1 Tax=Nycticebus coucang TaxID=9470 RepID=UPI00234C72E2|nr:trem-like transcript 4 protein [Nycticebus coucang]
MARGVPHLLLLPVLLVLLTSGCRGKLPEELHQALGQTLSLKCWYSPTTGPYQPKAWCQQTSPNRCTILVQSSKARTAAQRSQYTIWDEPKAGFFNVTKTQLMKNDSGSYWCGIYNSSSNIIIVLRNITLVVTPAPTTLPMWTLTSLPTRTGPITSPVGPSSHPSVNGSDTRKSSAPLHLDSAAPRLLVSELCGLLVAMALVL